MRKITAALTAAILSLSLASVAPAKSTHYPAPSTGTVCAPSGVAHGLGLQYAPDGSMSFVRLSSAKGYRSAHLAPGVCLQYVGGKGVRFVDAR